MAEAAIAAADVGDEEEFAVLVRETTESSPAPRAASGVEVARYTSYGSTTRSGAVDSAERS